ncbi:MAG: hypothetical protein M3266_05040 [Actinomycetota bacterium]|nr:hypothetical protein [Actinomycetota bacterium]
MSSGTSVPYDALLVQLVRGSLGQNAETRDLLGPNVSSCSFVVTLHGGVGGVEERHVIEEVARRVTRCPGPGEEDDRTVAVIWWQGDLVS